MAKAEPVSMVVRGRLSFVNVFTPRAMEEGQTPKFGVCVMIPEGDPQVKLIDKTIRKLANDEWGPGSDKKLGQPNGIKNIFRSGSERAEEYPEFTGVMFFSANSTRRPGMVDKDLQPIISQEDIYSGVDAQVAVNFYTYERGGKGIAAGLNHIRVLRKLDSFSGGGDPAKVQWPEVADTEDDGEDPLS